VTPRLARVSSLIVRAVLALGVTGCISAPEQVEPMCSTTNDCASGEVCEEGVCWGNPPAGPFFITVTPPADRDLMPVELEMSELPQDGYTGDLTLDNPARITARVEQFCPTGCANAAIPATITVRRPSKFVGGPGFQTVFGVTNVAAETGPTLDRKLPETKPDDPLYTITIVPDGRGDSPASTSQPAQLVPPIQLTLKVTPPHTEMGTVILGGDMLVTITGNVQSSIGAKLPHYRVVALGRWAEDQPTTEVSTVAYTDTSGKYTLQLSPGLVGTIDVVARSYDPETAPVLHTGPIQPVSSTINLVQPAELGNPVPVHVTIRGLTAGGQVGPIVGATVSVSAVTASGFSNPAFAALTAAPTSVTDATGSVDVQLLDGDAFVGLYKLRVIPPAGSNLGVIYDRDFELADDHSDIRLPSRIALHGVLVDSTGAPLGGVSVTAKPALKLEWALDTRAQQFLAQIPAATASTPETGDFVVFLDAQIGDTWASYDLAFEPATSSRAPNAVQSQIDIPRDITRTDDDLGTITIPAAAFVHGRIVDHRPNPVEGGEIRVFRAPVYTNPNNADLCRQAAHAPAGCPIPAVLLGHGTSDDLGIVRLTLPR